MSRIYDKLATIPFLSKSYTLKFLFIAFLGIHIPLIGLIIFVLFSPESMDTTTVLVLTLLLTLAATGITLYILNGLLVPLRRGKEALQAYNENRYLPNLPTHYVDEAGILMSNIQITLHEFNDLLEEKKDMSSLLSHDLKIPIRNVKTFAKLLRNNDPEINVEEVASLIEESVEEQAALLNNVLDIIRQDDLFFSNNTFQEVPVAKLLDETLGSFETVADVKGIRLKVKLDYDGVVSVQPELFIQVLKNLASNAIKFSRENSEVLFHTHVTGNRIQIDVKDSGIGFEPHVAEQLFERFTNKGRKGTAGEPTTGIGLYLSRKIIRRHHGELVANSEGAEKGSTFSIVL